MVVLMDPPSKYPAVLVSRPGYAIPLELPRTGHTDETYKTLIELPDGLHAVPDLPEASDQDRSFARVLTRTMFLEENPG